MPAPRSIPRAELPAELLKRLEFKVLRRLDGFLFGDYSGVFYGPSLDLAEVREYQPGDEVRRIDWNVTARTGTVHVRQFREEREVLAWLVVDRSASMDFGTRRVLKRDLALEFAAVAAAVVARKGKVGAITFSEEGLRVTPPGAGRRQTVRVIEGLSASRAVEATAPRRVDAVAAGGRRPGAVADAARSSRAVAAVGAKGGSGLAGALGLAHRTLRRRALVFVVSDFLEGSRAVPGAAQAADDAPVPSWKRAITRLGLEHDVVAVRVRDPAERALPNVGEIRVRDLESRQEIWLDTSDPRVRRAYAGLVGRRDRAIVRALNGAQVDLLELSTERDVVEPILRFVMRRRGRRA